MADPVHFEYRSLYGPLESRGPVTPAARTECPVCGKEPQSLSNDHVFPQFLGGKRTVNACKSCNAVCGHTFEALANERAFLPLYVYLSGLGLTTVRDGCEWRKAYVRDGNTYNLVGSDGRMVEWLTNPIIKRDAGGQIESAQFADARAARDFLRLAKQRGQQVRVAEEPRQDRIAEGLRIYFDPEWYVQRVALKMALAASALLPYNATQRTEPAREELRRPVEEDSPRCWPSAIEYADLTEACLPLQHAIFVEAREDRVYAVVQFFGFMQFYCMLGEVRSSKRPAAVFATLDPLTGAEAFGSAEPRNLPSQSEYWVADEATAVAVADSMGPWWADQLRSQAVARGGKDIPLTLPDEDEAA